jgi:hypothetical protein
MPQKDPELYEINRSIKKWARRARQETAKLSNTLLHVTELEQKRQDILRKREEQREVK